eukprot:CAMPEP_0198679208 /NCGR_PEP_ID=MMETSP1468-20131203/2256_1 /TAXON_ID=1461545 /ORGANISM="Mantoniella sp, Strain CCMP1436" /LENGTH=342 /DNA_ID=CAMNT_0044417579 /DNA_START=127 /DNA_END=1155 /DNA_ORIENTATION=-
MPTRILAAEYGADIVYSEEIIDRRLLMCKRVENPTWGTIDYVDTESQSGNIIFRTFPEERDRLVLQLGTGDAARALQCAMLVAKDVSAIDINMGCPLKFSTSSGAGSALLKKPETIRDILTTLRRNLPSDVHVTCKIRLMATVEETVDLARTIEACGVSAFAVHGRYVSQRPRDPAHWDLVKQVVGSVSCPVIANGDVFEYADFEKLRSETGAAGAMCARGAMWNQSIFRKEGLLQPRENLNALLTKCLEWRHPLKNTKYLLREMLIKDKDSGLETEEGRALNKSETLQDVAKLFNLQESLVGAKERQLVAATGLKRPCDATIHDEEQIEEVSRQRSSLRVE